jgi:transcription initiation factor IIE alpha subunit
MQVINDQISPCCKTSVGQMKWGKFTTYVCTKCGNELVFIPASWEFSKKKDLIDTLEIDVKDDIKTTDHGPAQM